MYAFFIKCCNSLISGLGVFLNFLISVLPNSPFKIIDNSPVSVYLEGMNYFIAVTEILDVSIAWLTCVGVYYIYQVAMRWIKAVD